MFCECRWIQLAANGGLNTCNRIIGRLRFLATTTRQILPRYRNIWAIGLHCTIKTPNSTMRSFHLLEYDVSFHLKFRQKLFQAYFSAWMAQSSTFHSLTAWLELSIYVVLRPKFNFSNSTMGSDRARQIQFDSSLQKRFPSVIRYRLVQHYM